MPQRSPTHEPPLAAIAHNIGLAHALAPTSTDDFPAGATLADVLAVLRDADPADKAEIYTQLGLRLTYQPSGRLVRTEVHIGPAQHWQFESVRGPSAPKSQYVLSGEFAPHGQR
jgi:hypothetical protein